MDGGRQSKLNIGSRKIVACSIIKFLHLKVNNAWQIHDQTVAVYRNDQGRR